MVCLLWSLTIAASLSPAVNFNQHLAVWSADSCSPSSYPSLRVLSEEGIRSRAGPQKIFAAPDVLLRTEDDLSPEGPPWLESRGPTGKYRAPGRPRGWLVSQVATAALERGVNYPKLPLPGNFFRPLTARNQNPWISTAFS